ncbi:terminase [Geodermatophilus chilensis]|uniref:terminase n=1 Tax=Geodermatophilus chilensis TaxID=2035835 RepID=UPI000C262C4D|nr:terminase [Geodermatophilus chilensis]
MSAKSPVSGLAPAGRRLWRKVTADYDLAEHERAVLLAACRTADVLERLEAEVAAVDLADWPRARGLLVEARQQRITLARLIAALRVPYEDDDEAPEARPRLQRRAARGVYGVQS